MLKKNLFFGASVLCSMAISMPAIAQVDTIDDQTTVNVEENIAVLTDGRNAVVLDEIIVTATKRETSLQDTPVAVTVTNADTIEKAQIVDIKDLQSVIPTLRVSQLQNAMNTSVSIRGFGNGGNNIGIEPAVGMFVDGVYRSRAAAQIGDLPNLERVEVLSGPQTTLFGKNASAGVVSVVTAAPSHETQGYLEGGIGNYAYNYVKGYITGGVSENTAISLGGGYQLRDGYFDSQTNSAHDMNNLKRFNFRGQVLWEPTDDFSLRVIADTSNIKENCCGVGVAQEGPLNGVSGPTAGDVVRLLGGNQPTAADQFSYENYLNRDTVNKIKASGISGQIDYKFGDMNFTSISAYRTTDADYDSDSDFTSLEILKNTFQYVGINTFTQEFRLTGDYDRFNWLGGLYYFKEKIDQDSGLIYGAHTRPYIDVLSGGALAGIEAGLGYPSGTFFADGTTIDETFSQKDEAFSAFGTVDFDVSDRITLTGGLNYTKDKKKVKMSTVNNDVFGNLTLGGADGIRLVSGNIYLNGQAPIPGALPNGIPSFSTAFFGLAPTPANFIALATGQYGAAAQAGFAAYSTGVNQFATAVVSNPATNPLAGLFALQFQPQFLAFPNSVEDGRTNDDELTWNVRLAFDLNENWNFYGSAATGFKASSWNLTRDSRPFLSDGTALQNANLLPNNYDPATGRNFGTRFADPEQALVYEIGVKARFNRGAFNFALFDQTIKNFQSTIFQGTGFVLSNAGKQSTTGIEFDGTWEPLDALKLTFGATLLDPVYDEFTNAPGPNGTSVDLSGEKPAGIPKASISTSATYEYDFDSGISAFVRGEYVYQSKTQIVDNVSGLDREVSTFNGSVGTEFNNGISLRLWGRNLFNDEYYTSAFPGVLQAGTSNAYPNQPRTYGVSLRKDF